MFHTRFTETLGSKDYISKVLTADRWDPKKYKIKFRDTSDFWNTQQRYLELNHLWIKSAVSRLVYTSLTYTTLQKEKLQSSYLEDYLEADMKPPKNNITS